jgi:hypothetical protein
MKNILLFITLFFLASCVKSDYRVSKPISPESLTKNTVEKVAFSFKATNFDKDLEGWIQKDVPDRAHIACDNNKPACNKASTILKKMGIPFTDKNHSELKNDIVLYYDSEQKLDCSKIVEGRSNLGCTTSSNMLNMTSDN